jgi:major membrane immunogen (membrane-anchored lipoprotein)
MIIRLIGICDQYDFDPNQSGGAGAVALEKAGRAKSFDIKSNWQQRVSGTIQIKDGKLIKPNLKWEDINSKKEK